VPLVDVRALVTAALGDVVELSIEPHRYATTHALTEVHVRLGDGRSVDLLFKELGDRGLVPEAVGRRPGFLVDRGREVRVYRSALAGRDLGTPVLHAGEEDGECGPWLLLERVSGVPLWQIGDLATWCRAAAWVGRFHASVTAAEASSVAGLARYDESYFARWPGRARALLAATDAGERLERVLEGYDSVVHALARLPRGFVHGDLYPSNVLVDVASRRIAPVDWELAGIGPTVLDLAALVAGAWEDAEREQLVDAYLGALPADARPDRRALRIDLARAELHLCIQWLGWAAGWEPPAEHTHDWIAIAERARARIDAG
jgi:Ser/Thr protein kinase RdoA (MazF antagonist)